VPVWDVCIASGMSNVDPIQEVIRKYGASETRRILVTREKWYRNMTTDAVKKRLNRWRWDCKRSALTTEHARTHT
jgi:hypothetical protein